LLILTNLLSANLNGQGRGFRKSPPKGAKNQEKKRMLSEILTRLEGIATKKK
jgi:hypothetical protein